MQHQLDSADRKARAVACLERAGSCWQGWGIPHTSHGPRPIITNHNRSLEIDFPLDVMYFTHAYGRAQFGRGGQVCH
jgi:hypothetical protein